MEKLYQQVFRARRRLIVQKFFRIIGWWLFATLVIATIGVAIPKLWVMGLSEAQSRIWVGSWMAGSLAFGVVGALVCAWWVRRGILEAAIEIDRRFGLRERVSSSLALSPEQRDSEAGQALIGDACHRVQRIDVGSQFQVRPNWRLLLPLVPAIALTVLVCFVDDKKVQAKTNPDGPVALEVKQQIQASTEDLRKKIADRRKRAEQEDLGDASDLFDRLEEGIDKLSAKEDIDRRKASIQLNDLSKQLKDRRESLGGTEQLKKQLDQLGKIDQGPADKVADALKDGDFRKALEEVEALKDKLEGGDLTDEEKKQLADQLDQMRDKLQEMVDAHREAREQLEQQIQQQAAQGNMEEVAKLQQQLDQLNQQCPQMNQMQEFADQLGQCAQCMQDGNLQDAAAQLDQMAAGLEDLQQQLDQLELLDDVMEQIADAKAAMNCPDCEGQGCGKCRGLGGGDGQDGKPGDGLGEGQGVGARPEKETDVNFYNTKVPTDPGPGAAVIVGRVHGPNVAGQAREQIKTEIEAARSESARPISSQRLPRAQREHAQQYFDSFREGEN